MNIQIFNQNDLGAAYALWESTIGDKWPISPDHFHAILRSAGRGNHHFMAKSRGQVVGFIATRSGKDGAKKPRGSIVVLLVDRKARRNGIGSKLLETAMGRLQSNGTFDVQLGSGSGSYFWPGVPENLPGAASFFKSHGWNYSEKSYDLVGKLNTVVIPSNVPISKTCAITTPATKDARQVLEFERINFPHWYAFFCDAFKQKDYKNILIARSKDGTVAGSVLLFGPDPTGADISCRWNILLGEQMGGFGALGVNNEFRGQGIGMAIAVKATEMLRERGVQNCYLGWTWLIDWYGKIGYKVWRSYLMSRRELHTIPEVAQ